jgi:N-hydroxyarylamine O-acetyltransferase
VGFGGSFVPPMRLADGEEVATPDGAATASAEDAEHGWMLERDGGEGWGRQYSFTLERIWPADLEAANHFTATRPDTRFTHASASPRRPLRTAMSRWSTGC